MKKIRKTKALKRKKPLKEMPVKQINNSKFNCKNKPNIRLLQKTNFKSDKLNPKKFSKSY